VLLDGLVASCVPDVVVPHRARLRLVVLVHMPLADHAADGNRVVARHEQEVLACAVAVVTTSEWTRDRLLHRHGLEPGRVHIAVPGADRAPLARGTPSGRRLVCVAAATPVKGHDRLLAALAGVADLPWQCCCAGAVDLDPRWARRLLRQAHRSGIADRVSFPGPLSGGDLDGLYAGSDLLVHASRAETWGLVVTEALARGLPVVATSVGGVPEALGHADDGSRPGLLVPPGDGAALAGALRAWLEDAGLRARLREAAVQRRARLADWSATSRRFAELLGSLSAPAGTPA
jgi:glycosyltransferase involved in cell wall biosynthesis